MKTKTYIKEYENERSAYAGMRIKNRACKNAGNHTDIYCVVDGPENNFAVVDLKTAIELGLGYSIKY